VEIKEKAFFMFVPLSDLKLIVGEENNTMKTSE
jgi:hypothetical protein